MAQVYFDTLKFVETLEAAGVSAAQARAISTAVKESHEAVDVATKRDLDDVRKELKADIAELRKDMEMIRKDIIIKFGGMLVVAVGVLAAIIKFPF
ncbi:DUF1640 domain-containing protein [Salmonella enterica]|nr:DUF1640 domain-containing protein [Salmonella enterica]EDC7633014.1 DUF1640 domain-containing protein [Salmonella enterica subsp. enterica serovar Litchfield]EDE3206769.1 DUF1640 domain-containing protein [Salmonella enterica subsp. enterica serovar Litchfield]EDN6794008.1 DUF1640 domain-containing protein [Salmonella enterica]EEJ0468940.1 DUF1640 domain-containing protein [Salmonella enterica]